MDKLISDFISAVRNAYPRSHREAILESQSGLASDLRDWTVQAEALESEFSVRYPILVRDLFVATLDTYVFFTSPAYRHLSLPIEAAEEMRCVSERDDDLWAEKIPIFDADGNHDMLDLSAYDPVTDDCPVVFFDHESSDTVTPICESFRQYLALLTIEIEAGDSRDDYSDDDYVTRMKSRGTSALSVMLDT